MVKILHLINILVGNYGNKNSFLFNLIIPFGIINISSKDKLS